MFPRDLLQQQARLVRKRFFQPYGSLNLLPLSSREIRARRSRIRVVFRERYSSDVQKSRQFKNVLADSWE